MVVDTELTQSRKDAEDKALILEEVDQFRYLLLLQNSVVGISKSKNLREKSVLKVQKLVNRLRRFNAELDKDGVISELEKLDVTMHLSEICDSICKGPLRVKDIPTLMEICSLLYQHYATDFTEAYKTSSWKNFIETNAALVNNPNDKNAITRRRIIPRLTIELILIGIINNEDLVEPLTRMISCLCETTRNTHTVESLIIQNVGVIESLCKRFDTAIIDVPSKPTQTNISTEVSGKEIIRKCCLNDTLKKYIRNKFTEFYITYSNTLLKKTKNTVNQQNNANQQKKIYRGKIDAESENKYQQALITYNKLNEQFDVLKTVLRISESTDDSGLNNNNEIPFNEKSTKDAVLVSPSQSDNRDNGNAENDVIDSIWDNETEKDFYCNLLNLTDAVPSILLNPTVIQPSNSKQSISKLSVNNEENNKKLNDNINDIAEANKDRETPVVEETGNLSKQVSFGQLSTKQEQLASDNEDSVENEVKDDSKKVLLLNHFFNKLNLCTSAHDVDQLAITFFYDRLNVSKMNRKKIIKNLTCLTRSDVYILPYISRFIATINPYFGNDIASVISNKLQTMYHNTSHKNPEIKIKIVKYLSELVKFKLIPVGTVYNICIDLINDFNHINVEILTSIIQNCGRFLLNYEGLSKDFNDNVLQKMLHLKNIRNLPVYCEVMIEDAYYYIFPKEYFNKKSNSKQKPRSIEKLYIKYLIFYSLNKNNIKAIVRAIRRLNWGDDKVHSWLYKILFKSISNSNINYNSYNTLALLLTSLAPIKPTFVILFIDYLMEYIQISLETVCTYALPTNIRIVKLIGELFNYRILSTDELLDLLYQFIGFGGPTSHGCSSSKVFRQLAIKTNNQHLLGESDGNLSKDIIPDQVPECEVQEANRLFDPTAPEDVNGDFLRAKFVCVILQTSGQYFVKGVFRTRINRFLAFFQRYLYFKQPLPVSVYLNIIDAISIINPQALIRLNDLRTIDNEIIAIVAEDEEVDNYEVTEVRELDEDNKILSEAESDENFTEPSSEEETYTTSVETDLDEDLIVEEDNAKNSDIEYSENVDAEELEKAFLDHEITALIGDGIREAKMINSVPKYRITLADDAKFRNLGKSNLTATDNVLSDQIQIQLVTKRPGKDNKIQAKVLQIPKENSIYQTMFKKAPVDTEEHAHLKRFVLDSVIRIRKQEYLEPQTGKYSLRRQHAIPAVHWRQSSTNTSESTSTEVKNIEFISRPNKTLLKGLHQKNNRRR